MGRILAANRHRQILDRAKQGADLSVSAMAAAFDVSMETVRRDLIELEAQGLLRRVFGGAVPIGRQGAPADDRAMVNAAGKAAIGAIVAGLVEPEMWVYVDSGTTALAAARALATGPSLRVLTHMPAIADALTAHEPSRHHVELTGGVYNPRHRRLTGDAILDTVRDRRFDLAIVGVHGMTIDDGVVDWNDASFRLKRRLLQRAQRCIWLADAQKFDKPAYHLTASFEDLDTLVTDRPPPDAFEDRLYEAGVTVRFPDTPMGIDAAYV